MKIVYGNSITLNGADVSHWNPTIKWPAFSAANQFCFLKATEGLKVLDSTFQAFSSTCTANKIEHGAYHYFHPALDAVEQANFFLSTIGKNGGTMPATLDLETVDGNPMNHNQDKIWAWITTVKAAMGKCPIIYGSPSFLAALALDVRFLACPLWIAEYGVSAPRVPEPFVSWKFWQWSASAPIAGIAGKCDADKFNGDMVALQAFIGLNEVPKQTKRSSK